MPERGRHRARAAAVFPLAALAVACATGGDAGGPSARWEVPAGAEESFARDRSKCLQMAHRVLGVGPRQSVDKEEFIACMGVQGWKARAR